MLGCRQPDSSQARWRPEFACLLTCARELQVRQWCLRWMGRGPTRYSISCAACAQSGYLYRVAAATLTPNRPRAAHRIESAKRPPFALKKNTRKRISVRPPYNYGGPSRASLDVQADAAMSFRRELNESGHPKLNPPSLYPILTGSPHPPPTVNRSFRQTP